MKINKSHETYQGHKKPAAERRRAGRGGEAGREALLYRVGDAARGEGAGVNLPPSLLSASPVSVLLWAV